MELDLCIDLDSLELLCRADDQIWRREIIGLEGAELQLLPLVQVFFNEKGGVIEKHPYAAKENSGRQCPEPKWMSTVQESETADGGIVAELIKDVFFFGDSVLDRVREMSKKGMPIRKRFRPRRSWGF